jgi:hypothetical protein
MAVQPITGDTHPILAALEACERAVEEVRDRQPGFMDTTAKETALRRLARLRAKLAELDLRLLAAADDVAEVHGARDPAAWLAHATRSDTSACRRDQAWRGRSTPGGCWSLVGWRQGRCRWSTPG